jgi:hypothetical protein
VDATTRRLHRQQLRLEKAAKLRDRERRYQLAGGDHALLLAGEFLRALRGR